MIWLRILAILGTVGDSLKTLLAVFRAARDAVKKGRVTRTLALPKTDWSNRFWGAFAFMFSVKEFTDMIISIISKGFGLGFLGFAHVFPDEAAKAIELVSEIPISFESQATKLAAKTMQGITGIAIDPLTIKAVGTPEEGRMRAVNIGGEFMQVVTQIFNVKAAQQDFATRTGIVGSAENLAAYFGTNLFFQMRSLTISTVASLTGWHTLRHLEALHQSVNWAFGFGWLSWAVMSEYMNVTTMPGIRRALNSQVKTNDYTKAQAVDAFVKGYINKETYNQILDNEGVMSDIRTGLESLSMRLLTIPEAISGYLMGQFTAAQLDVHLQRQSFDRQYTDQLIYQRQNTVPAAQAAKALVEGRINDQQYEELVNRLTLTPEAKTLEKAMAEKQISDADLLTLWQEDMVDEAYLKQAFRWQGYGEERATKEVQLLTLERQIKLRDKYVQINYGLYRDCVIEEQEFRQILIDAHYNIDEANQMVANALAERRTRQFLPTTDMFKAVKKGLLDVNDAINSLQCRGWTYDDAVVEALLRLEQELPPCDSVKLEEKALIGLLQALGANLGVSGRLLRPNVLKYLQCLNLEFFLVPPVVNITSEPSFLPAPGNVRLTWKATLATHARIEPTIGPVALEGSTTLHVAHSTGFTITAESPIGKATAFTFVDVTPK